jgi:hypothetical protein
MVPAANVKIALTSMVGWGVAPILQDVRAAASNKVVPVQVNLLKRMINLRHGLNILMDLLLPPQHPMLIRLQISIRTRLPWSILLFYVIPSNILRKTAMAGRLMVNEMG